MRLTDEMMQFVRRVILSDDTDQSLKVEALDLYVRNMGTLSIVDANGTEIAHIIEEDALHIRRFLTGESSGKIKAIKHLRSRTGLGIKEAKDVIENPQNFEQPKI